MTAQSRFASDIRILSTSLTREELPYRSPIKFGGRVVTSATILHAKVEAQSRDGRRATGFGSMPMGNVWAWPSTLVSEEMSLKAMLWIADEIGRRAESSGEYGHPIELGHELVHAVPPILDAAKEKLALPEGPPKLAALVATSPIDAAIHDAFGRMLGVNSFQALGPAYSSKDLSYFLDNRFRNDWLDRYVRATIAPRKPLYHLVGALDPLSDADLTNRLQDGLPETLRDWIPANGLTHFKIKLAGDDFRWDLERTISVDRICSETQAERGVSHWWYSCDFNEKCPSVDYVTEFLDRLASECPMAAKRLQYVEQPISRKVWTDSAFRVDEIANRKPVVIDESLVDYDSILHARDLGYSGVALKACKGQTESLLMAAAAQKFHMFLCVQDLTCTGFSFLHSASIAAWIPGVAAIEGNGRQYCPAGNTSWDARYPGMFQIRDGCVETGLLTESGLGFSPPK